MGMADDDLDEDLLADEGEPQEDPDEAELEDLDDDLDEVDLDDDALDDEVLDDEVLDDEVLDTEDEVTAAEPDRPVHVVPARDEDEDDDDDEEADADDVEASLDVILKERLVVIDDDDEDDEDGSEGEDRPDSPLKVLPKQPGEFVCQSCFLVKHPSQLADREAMVCRDCL
jgi:hypothetical protein